jgi:fatty-acid desaturase
MNNRLTLLVVQIYIHMAFLLGLLYFSATFSLISILVCQIVFVGLCGTVYYHRVVTHKNPIKPFLEKFLLFLSWVGCSGSAIAWAATHRMHHRFSDTEKDPHSPQHVGKLHAYWWSSGAEKSIRYVPDLLRNPLYVWQHAHYFTVLLAYHIIVMALLPLSIYWAICIVPAFCMWFAGSMVNILGHDSLGPINSNILGLMFAGEGWHKNHHVDPSSPKFNSKGDWGHMIYGLIRRKS